MESGIGDFLIRYSVRLLMIPVYQVGALEPQYHAFALWNLIVTPPYRSVRNRAICLAIWLYPLIILV